MITNDPYLVSDLYQHLNREQRQQIARIDNVNGECVIHLHQNYNASHAILITATLLKACPSIQLPYDFSTGIDGNQVVFSFYIV